MAIGIPRVEYSRVASNLGQDIKSGFSLVGKQIDKTIAKNEVNRLLEDFKGLKTKAAEEIGNFMNGKYSQKQIDIAKQQIMAAENKKEFLTYMADFYNNNQLFDKYDSIKLRPNFTQKPENYNKFATPYIEKSEKAAEEAQKERERQTVRGAIIGGKKTVPVGEEKRVELAGGETFTEQDITRQELPAAKHTGEVAERLTGTEDPELVKRMTQAYGVPSPLEAHREERLSKEQELKVKDMTNEQWERKLKQRKYQLDLRKQQIAESKEKVANLETQLKSTREDFKIAITDLKDINQAVEDEKAAQKEKKPIDREPAKLFDLEEKQKDLQLHHDKLKEQIKEINDYIRHASYIPQGGSGGGGAGAGAGSTAEAMDYTIDESAKVAKWRSKGYSEDQIRAAITKLREGQG